MKNKLLEAIQKGIQMGLEIQDDEQDQTIFQKSEVTSGFNTGRTDQIRWSRENFVDLGLPSGTLWCKHNLGATCGRVFKSWYGDYYAWGETKPKTQYLFKNYKFAKDGAMTKYTSNDSLFAIDTKDDAARLVTKYSRIPTRDDFEELCSLQSEYVTNYNDVFGLNGMLFTGNNGNTLFIPAAGQCEGSDVIADGECADLWANTRSFKSNYAYCLYFDDDCNIDYSNVEYRHYGMPIRPVI